MKLSVKLPLTICTALLLTVGAGLFGIYQLNQSIATYDRVIARDYEQVRVAAEMLVDFKTQVQEWKDTLLRGKDPKKLEKYWAAFQKHEGEVAASAAKLLDALPPGEARELVAKFKQAHLEMGGEIPPGVRGFQGCEPGFGSGRRSSGRHGQGAVGITRAGGHQDYG